MRCALADTRFFEGRAPIHLTRRLVAEPGFTSRRVSENVATLKERPALLSCQCVKRGLKQIHIATFISLGAVIIHATVTFTLDANVLFSKIYIDPFDGIAT